MCNRSNMDEKKNKLHLRAYLPDPVPDKGGDDDCGEAECDEAVLHHLHDGGQDHQVGVEGVQDGPVDETALRTQRAGRTSTPVKNTTTRRQLGPVLGSPHSMQRGRPFFKTAYQWCELMFCFVLFFSGDF